MLIPVEITVEAGNSLSTIGLLAGSNLSFKCRFEALTTSWGGGGGS